MTNAKFIGHLLIQQVCHDGSTHHLFRRHVFCTRQVKYRLWQRYLLRARPLCCSPSMQGWHRHYSLLLQSRLVAVFEVLPNQSDHPSPWRRTELLKNPRTIYDYNYIKNQEMLGPSSRNRWLCPCANNLSYLTVSLQALYSFELLRFTRK